MTDIAEIKKIITDEELANAFEGTSFGNNPDYRHILADTLLKLGTVYSTGFTAKKVAQYLGLVTDKGNLTKKGKEYLFYAFYTRQPQDNTEALEALDKLQDWDTDDDCAEIFDTIREALGGSCHTF